MDKKKLESRVSNTKEAARKDLARREKLNIRFSEEEIGRIFEAAERNDTRVMPLLRTWVIAALENDEARTEKKARKRGYTYPFAKEGSDMVSEPTYSDSLLILMNRLSDVETRLEILETEKGRKKRSQAYKGS